MVDVRGLLRRPLVVAPMSGGPSTPALVAAAADVGALGMLAAGYKAPDAVQAELAAVRAATGEAFGLNLFVPGAPTAEPDRLAAYLEALDADAAAVGAVPGEAAWDDDRFEDKVAVALAAAPALLSFTFGCPPAEVVSACRAAGIAVVVTVTGPGEATAAAAGADALCVQGVAAGAHRGTFANDDRPGHNDGTGHGGPGHGDDRIGHGGDLPALVGEVARVTDLPLLAAGGIVHPDQVRAVLAAGAVAAQCGTAFLRCPESGAHPVHKAALADPRFTTTTLTRAFSGRPARALVNGFVLAHPDAPAAYPEVNNATRPLRAAAAGRGDADRMSLYAGLGFRHATDRPAGEVVDLLCPPSRPGRRTGDTGHPGHTGHPGGADRPGGAGR